MKETVKPLKTQKPIFDDPSYQTHETDTVLHPILMYRVGENFLPTAVQFYQLFSITSCVSDWLGV